IYMGIGAAEKSHPMADDGRGPDFSGGGRFPRRLSRIAIHGIDLARVTAKEYFVAGKRRRGVDVVRGLKLPLLAAFFDIYGVQASRHRGHVQNSGAQHRRRTDGASHADVPAYT